MLSPHDRVYYEARADAELDLAQRSIDPCAVKIHYDLASRYLSILHDGADEPPAFAALNHARSYEARAKVGKAEVSR
ncbi:MAG: hypothetical protein EOP64_00485 [Sphingomonas sp.]|nr:MAG: hypothetical protein EOP64_00485 [Sphingomonas sp.]